MELDIKEEDIGSKVVESLKSLNEKDFENANWPVVSSASKESFGLQDEDLVKNTYFLKQVLNPKNFITPNQSTYDPEKDVLFVVHSFKNEKGNECMFKTITTSPDLLIKDPVHMINYRYHGLPCEGRSRNFGGRGDGYPTCDFWQDLYDRLPKDERGAYPIPTKAWREKFIKKEFLQKGFMN